MPKYRKFTLLEVVIAFAIMALSLTMALTVTGSSKDRTIKAQSRYARQHLLSLCCEYYLLAGHDSQLPRGLLPEAFSATCDLTAVEENLPDYAIEPISGWILGEYHISVYDEKGVMFASQKIRKLVKEEDI